MGKLQSAKDLNGIVNTFPPRYKSYLLDILLKGYTIDILHDYIFKSVFVSNVENLHYIRMR